MTERAAQTEAIVDPATHGLDVYAVGGAIRDALLGLPVLVLVWLASRIKTGPGA